MGGRSRAAAQLLSGRGFKEVYNLAGGIKAWQGEVARGPVEANLELISGKETPAEMLTIIFGMEEAMRVFYERLSREVKTPDAARLFGELSELEIDHKQTVYNLYRARGGEVATIEGLEERASRKVMEGGLNPDEILEAIEPKASTVEDILSYAMMLETQALDLFLRFSQHSADDSTSKVLLELADQEKGHLKMLGDLMEKHLGDA